MVENQSLSMIDAAHFILSELGTPQHYNVIVAEAISRGLISTNGLTPGASLVSAVSRENSARISRGEIPRFDVLGGGHYGLVEWRPTGIEQQIQQINKTTREKLRQRISQMPPKDFEDLIGKLLIQIGFEEVEVRGRSGDGGIDVVGVMDIGGVARIDVAVQVKRVKINISPDKITSLRGSLHPNQRGIFITTSRYTRQAVNEATEKGKSPISLIDGEQLLSLLFVHKIGLSSEHHEVFELDSVYWPEVPSPVAPVWSSSGDKVAREVSVTYPLGIFVKHQGQTVKATLLETGQVVLDQQTFSSVSAAGIAVTGWKACNGWRFWRFVNPGDQNEYLLAALKQS